MYATCLFCNAPFEKNESLEAFPVGRRLAFDEAKGRLWVVCKKCERWSLSPLDERWEAIEQAERLYRDTRKRVSTDNIGLAKVAEGTTLIRIGKPLRPEFAAWRYGDQFGRRRTRQMLIAGGGVAAVSAVMAGGFAIGVSMGGFSWIIGRIAQRAIDGSSEELIARIPEPDGRSLEIRRKHLAQATVWRAPDGSMALTVRHTRVGGGIHSDFGECSSELAGDDAKRIAGILLPAVNRFGGNQRHVSAAVNEIEKAGTAEQYVGELSKTAHFYTRDIAETSPPFGGHNTKAGLFALPTPQRLALEMALHEEAERRALEGELAELERAWRDAEEIAAISDNLTVPDSVSTALDQLKQR